MEGVRRVLAIGTSDPAGAGGIQGDIRTMTHLGVDATAVLTALAPPEANVFRHPGRAYAAAVREQMATLKSTPFDAVKIGVVPTAEVAAAVALEAHQLAGVPIVLDVAISGGETGDPADQATVDAIRFDLVPIATVVIVSRAEAIELVGVALAPADTCRAILEMGAGWALIEGVGEPGQGREDILTDGEKWFALRTSTDMAAAVGAKSPTPAAGAMFSAALTAMIGSGLGVPEAAVLAQQYVLESLGLVAAGTWRAAIAAAGT